MFFRLILLLFIGLSQHGWAKLYSSDEIQDFEMNTVTTQFVAGFFTSKTPQNYIADNAKLKKEPLLVEYQLFQLLKEISYKNKQNYLQDFVKQMEHYPIAAFKRHEEGRMQIPVYNLAAKAQGIENIWQAAQSLNYYQNAFKNDTNEILDELIEMLPKLSNPQWFGLKNSLKTLNKEQQILIDNYLLSSHENLKSLSKFTAHYSLITRNKELIEESLLVLDKSNSEYILRKMPEYFDKKFVIDQLIKTVKNSSNKAFALSLMKPYLDKSSEINNFLLHALNDKKLASHAAFALTNTQQLKTLMQLKNQYSTSQSDFEKRQIVFVLKMNKSPESQVILKNLDKNHISNKWLESFSGEIQ